MNGRIHSIESFGTVDGPGIRLVVFLQGCPMRCQYCHNPDTWEIGKGKGTTVKEILDEFERCKMFYTGGGITVTGGEPLLQMEFVTELFEAARAKNIHTCLDTSGVTFDGRDTAEFDRLIKSTNLILLDIKHINSAEHKKLTAHNNENIIEFAKYLDRNNVPVWIRHVVVPTITENEKYLYELGQFIGTLRNVEVLDVLPYHTMGKVKYESLGMAYPLEGIEDATKELADKAKKVILSGVRDVRKK